MLFSIFFSNTGTKYLENNMKEQTDDRVVKLESQQVLSGIYMIMDKTSLKQHLICI